ncbi:MAG: PrgI family protein [Ruminococcaceae bacterium]|nr:PrgI family protein [Oscillospiraceae bacterium]
MARLIPDKAKSKNEIYRGMTLTDLIIGTIAFLMIVFVAISALPLKLLIILAVIVITVLLLIRIDMQPNYIYVLHFLRHFVLNHRFARDVSDEILLDRKESKKKAFGELFTEEENAASAQEQALRQEELNRLLSDPNVSEEVKEKIRQHRAAEESRLAQNAPHATEDKMKCTPVEQLCAFTDISDDYIVYSNQYYGAVLELPIVEFGIFNKEQRSQMIENGFGKLLRSLTAEYCTNIVKLERPIKYTDYIQREQGRMERLKAAFDEGRLTEVELQACASILYDRIPSAQEPCFEDNVIVPFYYIVLFDGDRFRLENQISNAIQLLNEVQLPAKRLGNKELAVFLKYSNYLDFDEAQIEQIEQRDYAAWAMPQSVHIRAKHVEINQIVTHNLRTVAYPVSAEDAWLAEVFAIPSTKCVVKCKPMEQDKAIRAINISLQDLHCQLVNTKAEAKKANLQAKIDELSALLETLKLENEALSEVNAYITAYDIPATEEKQKKAYRSDLPRLPMIKKTVRRAFKHRDIRLNNMDFDQMYAFIGAQVSGYDPLQKSAHGIPVSSLAAGAPWIYTGISGFGDMLPNKSEDVSAVINSFSREEQEDEGATVVLAEPMIEEGDMTEIIVAMEPEKNEAISEDVATREECSGETLAEDHQTAEE